MLDIRLGDLDTRKQASRSRHRQRIFMLDTHLGDHARTNCSIETFSEHLHVRHPPVRPGHVETT
eukprot:5607946-Pyramimonas_sp.AAC.1